MALGEHEIHLWYTSDDETWDPARLARSRALMNPAERARCDRLYFERDRRLFTLARALVRCALSRYAPVAPDAWCFVEGSHGKPRIDVDRVSAPEARGLYFNLSHTHGLVACAITRMTPEVGVDVERLDRTTELLSIAGHYFSASEVADLRARPAAEQRPCFFAYWTLKEAYIKARGLGLSLPLEQFSFHLCDGAGITVSFDPRLEDQPDTWAFWLARLATTHHIALGVRRARDVDPSVRAHAWIPPGLL